MYGSISDFFKSTYEAKFVKTTIFLEEGTNVRKKESVASIIVDTKESLKTPLIIQTQSIESLSEPDEPLSRPPSLKFRYLFFTFPRTRIAQNSIYVIINNNFQIYKQRSYPRILFRDILKYSSR